MAIGLCMVYHFFANSHPVQTALVALRATIFCMRALSSALVHLRRPSEACFPVLAQARLPTPSKLIPLSPEDHYSSPLPVAVCAYGSSYSHSFHCFEQLSINNITHSPLLHSIFIRCLERSFFFLPQCNWVKFLLSDEVVLGMPVTSKEILCATSLPIFVVHVCCGPDCFNDFRLILVSGLQTSWTPPC